MWIMSFLILFDFFFYFSNYLLVLMIFFAISFSGAQAEQRKGCDALSKAVSRLQPVRSRITLLISLIIGSSWDNLSWFFLAGSPL